MARNWELFTPLVQVSFGIGRELPYETPILIHTAKDLKIGMTNMEYGYSLMNYSYDSTMAPEGKTTLVMRYESPWKLWEHLEGEEYRKEKEQMTYFATSSTESCIEKTH
jgi:hypothetical protein